MSFLSLGRVEHGIVEIDAGDLMTVRSYRN